MQFYRVRLSTLTADFTPVPGYLNGFGVNELGDLTWIPPEFENGYLVGFAWWPEVNVTAPISMYERYVGPPTLTVNQSNRTVETLYQIVPWSVDEIAADKLDKYMEAGNLVNRVVEDHCDEVARRFGFFGRTPFLMALSFQGSTLPDEKARAAALSEWRDIIRTECVTIVNEVLLSGNRLSEDIVIARLPAPPAIPVLQEPVDPPADPEPPVDPEPDPAP